MKEKIGKKFYSPYFKQMIEVVEYVDDNHWSFKLENGKLCNAQTPLNYFEGHDFTRDNPKRAVKQDMSKGQFVDGTDKTNDKIEEIIERKLRYCPEVREADIYRVHRIRVEELKGELSTLIQAERKEAVRGFVDTIEWEKINGVDDDDDAIRGRNLVEQMETYLQTLKENKE